MNNLKFLTFAIAASLPLILTGPAGANDNNDSRDKGGQRGENRGGHEGSQVSRGGGSPHYSTPSGYAGGSTRFSSGGFHGQSAGVSGGRAYTSPGNQSVTKGSPVYQGQHGSPGYNNASGGHYYNGNRGPGVSTGSPGNHFYNSNGYHSPASGHYYHQGNNYGGRWCPANSHPNWNQNRRYYWNNHQYCWFNGGWLNIDGGFWPSGYSYPYGYYSTPVYQPYSYAADTTIMNVQQSLARLGYYSGDVDGAFGPLTSAAIRRYQYDNGLPVTGRITSSLLNALGFY
ncbi:MAG: peptidoglycan-binding domain-containing protein [Verrucomicrobiota bacterium]